MNQSLALTLLGIPAFTSAIALTILSPQPAMAGDLAQPLETASCSIPTKAPAHTRLDAKDLSQFSAAVLTKSSESTQALLDGESAILDFTAAESDAAVALFGCDCPSCISALRQLQQQPMVVATAEGHCFNALERRGTTDDVKDVLRTLDNL